MILINMNKILPNDLYINPTKIFINKIWNEDIVNNNSKGLNNLNNKFIDNLILKPNNINISQNIDYTDNFFSNKYYGIQHNKKISNNYVDLQNTNDNIYIDTIYNYNNFYFTKVNKLNNKIVSQPLYKYNLVVNNDDNIVIFNDNNKYIVDYLNSNYSDQDIAIDVVEKNINALSFYSNTIIKNPNMLSLTVINSNKIINFIDYNTIYRVELNDNINVATDDIINMMYNNIPINIVTYNGNTNILEFTSKDINTIDTNQFIRVERVIGYKSYSVIQTETIVTRIDFITSTTNSIDDFFMKDNTDTSQTYITLNTIDYKLYYNTENNYYYLNATPYEDYNLDTIYRVNTTVTIFKLTYITNILETNERIMEISLDNGIDLMYHDNINYIYKYSIENYPITINDIEIITSTKIKIKYLLNNIDAINNIINYNFIHKYNINESPEYTVTEINKNERYQYKLLNIFGLLYDKNATIEIYSPILYSSNVTLEDNMICFETTNNNIDEVSKYNFILTKMEKLDNNNIVGLYYDNVNLYIYFKLSQEQWYQEYYVVNTIDYKNSNNIFNGKRVVNNNYVNEINNIVIKHNNTTIYSGTEGEILYYEYKNSYYVMYRKQNITINNYDSSKLSIECNIDNTYLVTKSYDIGILDIDNNDTITIDGEIVNNIIDVISDKDYDFYLLYNDISKKIISKQYDGNDLTIIIEENITITAQQSYLLLRLKNIVVEEHEYFNNIDILSDSNLYIMNQTNIAIPQLKLYSDDFKEYTYPNQYLLVINDYAQYIDIAISSTIYSEFENQENIVLNNGKEYNCRIIMIKKEIIDELVNYYIYLGTKDDIDISTSYSVRTINNLLDTQTVLLPIYKINILYNVLKFNNYIDGGINCYIKNNVFIEQDMDYNINNVVKRSKYYMNYKYDSVKLENKSYNNPGFKKIEDIVEIVKTEETQYIAPKWIEELSIKLFKLIEFSIDDIVLDKIDYNVYKILFNFNYTIFKEGMFKMVSLLKYNNDNSIYFYLPLKCFFTTFSDYLPVYALRKSNIKIKFYTDKLENLITNFSNKYDMKTIEKPIIDFYYNTFYLDTELVKKFDTKYNYLCQISGIYSKYYLTNLVNEYHININGLVKDLFLVAEGENVILEEQDTIYKKFIEEYNMYINNELNRYSELYNLFNTINNEIKSGSTRINVVKANEILSQYNIMFILYLDDKYLNYIDEDINIVSSYSNKITILMLYFINTYRNIKYSSVESGILDKIDIKINGVNLLPELSGKYYNDVIPYTKGYYLLDNFYVYSFGLNSKSKQPNGYLNMKLIENILIRTTLKNIQKNGELKIYTREYKILELENGKMKKVI